MQLLKVRARLHQCRSRPLLLRIIMFQALVLACLATNPNICQTLEDLYGPYETKKECTTRAYEIAVELPEYLPNYVAMKYKCVDVSDKRKDKSI